MARAAVSDGCQGNGLRVLVVEDYADCAQSTAMLLRMYGHDVEVAEDGPTAWACARSHCPDVVLLDIGLPGMDGWEVAKRIKAEASARKPWLIAISGYGREVDQIHSAETGIDLHLIKPVDPEKLKSLLDEIAGNRFHPTEYAPIATESEAHHEQPNNEASCHPIG